VKSSLKKNIAAGIVGLALLAGTAPTYATWFAEHRTVVGTARTGNLEMTAVDLQWELEGKDSLDDVIFVPGHKVTAKVYADVTLSGLELKDLEFHGAVDEDIEVDEQGFVHDVDGRTTPFRLSFTANDTITSAQDEIGTLTVEFVRQDHDNRDHMNDSFALGGLTVTARQRHAE